MAVLRLSPDGQENTGRCSTPVNLYEERASDPHRASEHTQFTALGFELLESSETVFPIRFYDVDALVYYADHIPWEFPGFSVEHCFSVLLELQREVKQQGYFETHWRWFFRVLRKPI